MEQINKLYEVVKVDKKSKVSILTDVYTPTEDEASLYQSAEVTDSPFDPLPFESDIKEVVASLKGTPHTIQKIVDTLGEVCYKIERTTYITIKSKK